MNNKQIIVKSLIDYYPTDKCALNFSSPYELLVAVILSAQCTDVRVNMVTKKLFAVANTPQQILNLGMDNLIKFIKPCGFFNNKATNILSASKSIVDNYNGEVPNTRKELIKLAGVGHKTASVVLACAFNVPAIAVDTHVFRLSKRLGLANESTPDKTMLKLQKVLPKEMWIDGHYALVLHGRTFCKAKNPDCCNCFISHLCKYNLKNNK